MGLKQIHKDNGMIERENERKKNYSAKDDN